jgi:hypothetical protein
MSAERQGKSHAMAWVLCILAVPVLYLLSVPPLLHCSMRDGMGILGPVLGVPTWVQEYSGPYNWIEANTPLRTPLFKYRVYWGLTR